MVRRHLRTAVALAALALSAPAWGQSKTIVMLDKGEPHEAMTVNDGHLWVGKSRLDFNSHYSVQAYDGEGRLVGEVALPHSATYLYPYSATSVLAFGTGYDPNLTQYTLIERRGTTLLARTVRIPMEAWGNLWVGTVGGREYFTDMGGNQNDPDRDNDMSLPSQTIFSMRSGASPRYLSTRLRMPIDGTTVGSRLFIVRREAMGSPQSNFVRVDPATGAMQSVFESHRNLLSKVIRVPSTSYVAVFETGAGQVHLIDTESLAVVATAEGLGQPKSLATLGHCLLAGDQFARTIAVIDLAGLRTGGPVKHFATLDVGLSEDEFRMLKNIAVDPARGRIYARSNFPCNPMTETCDKDYNRVVMLTGDAVGAAVARCQDGEAL